MNIEINKSNNLTKEQMEYINKNINIEVLRDKASMPYIKLSIPTFYENRKCTAEVNFYAQEFETEVETVEEWLSYTRTSKVIGGFVKFPLKLGENGSYLKVNEEIKEMTKEEIEKELGYKIKIV